MRRGHRQVRRAAVALAAAAALLLAGCTGGEDENQSPSPGPVPDPTRSTVSPAATPVPAPTPGSTRSSVPSEPVQERRPVALDAEGRAAAGVTVRLTSVEAIDAEASGPGEVAGPALAITVAVVNTSDQALDLGSSVVNLTAADDAPGSLMSAAPADPLPTTVAAGATATGVYVFTVPTDQRDPVTVQVAVTPSSPVVVFRGQPA